MPADERLDAHDGTGLEIHLGLIVQDEFLPRHRLAKIGLHRLALDRVRVHLGPEELIVVAPVYFAWYIAKSAFLSSVCASIASSGKGGDADARGDAQIMIGDAMRRIERGDDLLRAQRGSCAWTTSASRMRNSSPPCLLTVSEFRTHACNRCATLLKS